MDNQSNRKTREDTPRFEKPKNGVESDSGYGSSLETPAPIYLKPRSMKRVRFALVGEQKLAPGKTWRLSDMFTWQQEMIQPGDALDDPYESSRHHSYRSLPRGPGAEDIGESSLDEGKFVSDCDYELCQRKQLRTKAFAHQFHQFHDYRSLPKGPGAGGNGSNPVGRYNINPGFYVSRDNEGSIKQGHLPQHVDEEDEEIDAAATTRMDPTTYRKGRRQAKSKDLERERNTDFYE